ncbi:MAG: DUF1501 domain-containing protein [Proteobacteria bacterium]|nr:DUF1501 domain-containing protein [Pseudomonadota bacterium]
MLCETPSLSRRALLGAGVSFTAWAHLPHFVHAAGARDPRLLVVILRGALDGLSTVAPLGDPDYEALRAGIALQKEGEHAALPLDGFFALHPAMPNFARLYRAGQGLVIHAAASPYRERSHFDGQDVLETGLPGVGRIDSGWLNRAMAALPAGERIAGRGGLAVGPTTPIILRGAAPVLGWAPPQLQPVGDDLAARVLDLYQHGDPALYKALKAGLDTDKMAKAGGMDEKAQGGSANPRGMVQVARGAGRLMAADDGPRVAVLAFDGWDTHANEGGAKGRLADLLGGLDGAFAAIEEQLKTVWKETAVLVVTEFGRTARVNGTEGTDHGTATVALLAGGAVKGGCIIADWPGLKEANLHERRDLRPTTDLRAVMKGLLQDHVGLGANVLNASVFPESGAIRPLAGLVA